MKRNLDEVIASQKVMLARKGESPEVVKQPQETAENIQKFLGRGLNIDNMVKSVDPSLYRQRSTGLSAGIQETDAGLSEHDNEKIKEQLASLGYM